MDRLEWSVTATDIAVWIRERRVRIGSMPEYSPIADSVYTEQKDTIESLCPRSIGATANYPLVAS